MDVVFKPAFFPLHQSFEDYTCDAERSCMFPIPGNLFFGSTFSSIK